MTKKPASVDHAIGLILKAAQFAAHKHKDIPRKDKNETPYINHPIEVAHVLYAEGGVRDPEMLAAALLHDTIEDTETTYDDLRGQFGARIADIVGEVTDTKFLRKQTRKQLQSVKAGHASPAAQQIKIADKLCNLRDILGSPPVDWTLAKKHEYFDEAKSVVGKARDANPALAAKFDRLFAHWSKKGLQEVTAARNRTTSRRQPENAAQPARKIRIDERDFIQVKLDSRKMSFEEMAKIVAEAIKQL